ncbi:MAG TPA: fumarylacetoacetate hydrolase family protein [Gaiellaceae bacterium]|nr:fumarylacetoacetate hydrolase family protein [Gaiellaceae bacterium]
MAWCRVSAGGAPRFGRVEGETIALVHGSPWDEPRTTGEQVPLAGATLLPPAIPSTFFCVGLNYRRHVEHALERGYKAAVLPARPEVGYRANNALVGHDAEIVRPADYEGRLEAEPELVAVIGRTARRCSRDEAHEAIFGWTIGNDVSARAWQDSDRTFWRCKNADTFKPMGPWIVTDFDLDSATTALTVNGEEASSFATADMIFDPFDFVAEISRYITMQPGDVLWMGADGSVEMRVGDTVEISISGIGTLRNRVVDEGLPQEGSP